MRIKDTLRVPEMQVCALADAGQSAARALLAAMSDLRISAIWRCFSAKSRR